jgi:UDP-glucuronate decarboxylase
MIDLVKIIKNVKNSEITFEIIDYPESYPSDEPNRRCPDIQKAIDHINYEPIVNLNEGLRRFLNWTDENFEGLQ